MGIGGYRMSEVEKLYKNAHIEKVINHECTYDYGITCPNDNDTCDNCGYYKEKEPDYQPFTAEKQLELIKWLAVKGDFDSSIDIAKNTYDYWTIYFQGARWTAEGFEESLAGLINNLWQDCTESEQEQIRSILNG
jgi:hypothetical protein